MTFIISGKPVSRIGFGGGELTAFGDVPTEAAIQVLKAVLNAGANFWNAGEHYGTAEYNSLHLLNAYFTKYPEDADKVVISVKGGFSIEKRGTACDAKGIKASIDNCLEILDGKCRIDVFQAARLDPNVPVEETVGAIAEYVKAGKIGGVGLSECSATSIRKAVAVTPIAAVEIELSLFETRIFTDGVAEACKEFNIPIVAYSPLNRGFLSGHLRKFEDLPENDYRRKFPRFQAENFAYNLQLVEEAEKLGRRKGATSNQIGLAWVSAQTDTIGVPVIPIPGTKSIEHMEENTKQVTLSKDELREMTEIVEKIEVKGGRVPEMFAHLLEV